MLKLSSSIVCPKCGTKNIYSDVFLCDECWYEIETSLSIPQGYTEIFITPSGMLRRVREPGWDRHAGPLKKMQFGNPQGH